MPDRTRKPVYINHVPGMRVWYEPHALNVREPRKATSRIPLRMIDRLLIHHKVKIELATLAACTAADIPIVIFNEDGETIGRMLGMRRPDDDLRKRLEQLTAYTDWYHRYFDWYHHQLSRIVRKQAHRLGKPQYQFDSWSLIEHIHNQIGGRIGKPRADALIARWTTLHRSKILQGLYRKGLDARDERWIRDRVDLIEGLTQLLAIQCSHLLVRWVIHRHRERQPIDARSLTAWFEEDWKDVQHETLKLMARLERWLIEIT